MGNNLEKQVQALTDEVAALKLELNELPKKIGEKILAAARKTAALADEPSGSYAEYLQQKAQTKNEEAMKQIATSIQAIRLGNLSKLSQEIAIGIILAKVLSADDKQQKKLSR